MSDKNIKENRKIVRMIADQYKEHSDTRLNEIEAYVKDRLTAIEKLNKNMHGWIVGEVKGKIQNDLHNATVTVDAVVEVLAEAGINIPDFASKIDAKKLEINKRLVEQAEAQMKADTQQTAGE